MDHLPLPHHPTKLLESVPLLCHPYDGGDFLTYPDRNGWLHAGSETPRGLFFNHEVANPSDIRALEAFLQCWLFFGLLHAIGAKHDDFVDGDTVHTRHLGSPKVDKRLIPLLDRTKDILRIFSLSSNGLGRPEFNQQVRKSIISLWGILAASAVMQYDWVVPSQRHTQIDAQHMLANGWCLSAIARERASTVKHSLPYEHYIEHLALPDSRDHTQCLAVCGHTTTSNRYRGKHICSIPCGGLVGPDPGKVDEILRNGTYPVLRVAYGTDTSLSLDGTIDVIPAANEAYVAISHVWAEGLGNEHNTELPLCQLERLNELVRSLRGRTFKRQFEDDPLRGRAPHPGDEYVIEERPLHLWIDSLLCPQHRDSYELSMSHMRSVYEKAAYVLVLDEVLQQSIYDDPIEAMVRIHVSQWASRLWTFQEATMASKLLIQFKNRIVDFVELLEYVVDAHEDVTQHRFIDHLIIRSIELLTNRLTTNGPRLATLWVAFSHRKVSRQEDQPLCAAALCGLDTARLAALRTLPERMAEFWTLLADSQMIIPSAIIFSRLPTLNVQGFRWAPDRMIHPQSLDYAVPSLRKKSAAVLTYTGLQVHLQSWRVTKPNHARALCTPCPKFERRMQNQLHVRSSDGQWYLLVYQVPLQCQKEAKVLTALEQAYQSEDMDWQLLSSRTSWHVLLDEHDTTDNSGFNGLVGIAHGERIVPTRLVAIFPYGQAQNIIAEAAFKHAMQIRWSINQWLLEILVLSLYCLNMLTSDILHPLTSRLFALGRTYETYQRHRLLDQLKQRSSVEQQSQVREAMLAVRPDWPWHEDWWSDLIWLSYIGRYATIDQSWTAEKGWIID